MVHSIRGRQGCRPLRFGWSVVRTGGGTHRSGPTNMDGLPRFAGGRDGGLAAYAARIAPSADGALDDRGFRPLRRAGVSRRVRRGYFAPCAGRVFRPLRRTTGGAASGLRDLGNAPPVGKRCRRGILCQSKAQLRRHTGCMARSWTPAVTPVVSCPIEKNRVKLLIFWGILGLTEVFSCSKCPLKNTTNTFPVCPLHPPATKTFSLPFSSASLCLSHRRRHLRHCPTDPHRLDGCRL